MGSQKIPGFNFPPAMWILLALMCYTIGWHQDQHYYTRWPDFRWWRRTFPSLPTLSYPIHAHIPYPFIYPSIQSEGDLWYFPEGNPHSIQAKNTTADGAEFLLVFDSGTFSEDTTFLLTDWLAHVPKHVLAKNFGKGTDVSAFEHIPKEALYIFRGAGIFNCKPDMCTLDLCSGFCA